MKIPFTNLHIHINIIPGKYYIQPIKKQLTEEMLNGNMVMAVKLLKAYGSKYGYTWSLKEAKEYVEANFKFKSKQDDCCE